jgi:hypothetical protein
MAMESGRSPLRGSGHLPSGLSQSSLSQAQPSVPNAGANGQPVELLAIGGRTVEVDAEIAPIVRALNEAGVATVASCSGHGVRPGNIALRDGREIIIARNHAEARQIERAA